ncbi:MAG: histidine kinase dimerization/phospho-acceptor domain-containing protein, partial [bacterium]
MKEKNWLCLKNLMMMFNLINEGVVCTDDKMRVVFFNKAFANIADVPAARITNANVLKFFLKNEKFLVHILNLEDKSLPASEITMEHNLRIYSLCVYSAAAIPGPAHRLILIKDVTMGIKEQERIQEQEKSTSLAHLTTGMAHEMNNPLSGISGFADLLIRKKQRFDLNDEVLDIIESIKENASRAATILSDLLIFSRTKKTYIQNVDIHDTLFKIIKSLHLPLKTEIKTDFKASLFMIHGDMERIKRAVANIFANATEGIAKKKNESAGFRG